MANTVNLTTVERLLAHTENTNFIVEENGELNRFNITDLNIDSGGDVTIDMTSGASSEANPINADTLGGYEVDYFASQGNLDEAIVDIDNKIAIKAEEIINNLDIGLKVELNYSIVGGLEEPTEPTENMIWVQTNEEITGHIFSKYEPKNPTQNMIWIYSGENSNVAFHSLNIDGKKYDEIFPISAKQYIDEAWMDVEAKSYQSGEWVPWWDGTLYYAGDEYELFTGGWGKVVNGSPSFTKNIDTLYVTRTDSSGSHLITHNKSVDLTNIKTVEFDYSCNTQSRTGFYVYNTNLEAVVSSDSQSSASGTCSLDVSALTGKHYIVFGVWFVASGTYNVTVSRIKLVS